MTGNCPRLDALLVSQQPLWPLDQGWALRGGNLARALAEMGVRVGVASLTGLPGAAPAELRALERPWPAASGAELESLVAAWRGWGRRWRLKLAAHQDLDVAELAGMVPLVRDLRPRVVIGLGQHSPLLLRALSHGAEGERRPVTIWYAADELLRFDLSCLRREGVGAWRRRLYHLGLHAALERLFVPGLDGAIGVSPQETRWLRGAAGARQAVTIRNGVDLEYYRPRPGQGEARTAVFWGRLDFEPNVDAVRWFALAVWPQLRRRHPDARWQIIGRNPGPAVRALHDPAQGVTVLGDVADLRDAVQAAAVAILPLRCGGGIKNKLLEAAALGVPAVASPLAVQGIDFGAGAALPVLVARTAEQWAGALHRLWSDAALAADLPRRARQWVEARHSWAAAARQLWTWAISLSPGRGEAKEAA